MGYLGVASGCDNLTSSPPEFVFEICREDGAIFEALKCTFCLSFRLFSETCHSGVCGQSNMKIDFKFKRQQHPVTRRAGEG